MEIGKATGSPVVESAKNPEEEKLRALENRIKQSKSMLKKIKSDGKMDEKTKNEKVKELEKQITQLQAEREALQTKGGQNSAQKGNSVASNKSVQSDLEKNQKLLETKKAEEEEGKEMKLHTLPGLDERA